MSNLSKKLEDHFSNVLIQYSEKIASIIYERDKHLFNDEQSKMAFKKDDMIEIYKKVLKDAVFNQLDLDEITEEYRALCISLNFSNQSDYSVSSKKVKKFLKDHQRSLEDFQYSESVKNLCAYLDYCISNDVTKEPDITVKNLCMKMDYYVSVSNSLEVTLREEDVYLTTSLKNIIKELEEYNIRSKDLYCILKKFLNKLIYAKGLYESDNLLFEEEESESDYLEIFRIIDKYNIINFDTIGSDSLKELLIELGVSRKEIISLIDYRDKTLEENKKTYTSNIDSGIDRYEDKKELHKKLQIKLSEYFDLKNMSIRRYLNREETSIVLSIFKELEYGEEIIRKFIWDNELLLYKEDLITKCEYILKKAEFYSSEFGFEREYNDFEDFYNRYLEVENKEDKELCYELLELSYKEISSLLASLPRTYEYELSVRNKNIKLLLLDKGNN